MKRIITMIRKTLLGMIVITIAVMVIQSCEKENENETRISTFNSDESHKVGQNCMECHVAGNAGEVWFSVAGTVYDSTLSSTYPNVLVYLYTGPKGTGTLEATIEVDGLGNFYTTEQIDLSDGLFPTVIGNIGSTNMLGTITNGQCNLCHGMSTEKIWTR
ncbi:MAG: hypothetical protein MUO43_18820 [Desulfobacterales bacterium]|nr:hypothetical protein [Desulfobacterales bacterium]